MNPKTAIALTLLGVLLAGAPLPLLLQRSEVTTPSTAPDIATELVPATLHFTGQPLRLQLSLHGRLLAEMPQGEASPWLPELTLPKDGADVELLAVWPEEGEQAVSLTLEPNGRKARTETQWVRGKELHTLFSFTW